MSARVVAFHDPVAFSHRTGPVHPENPGRLEACVAGLRLGGVTLLSPPSPPRTMDAVERVHSRGYVQRLRRAVNGAPREARGEPFALFDSPDNPISSGTWDAAMRAVGLALAASDEVTAGRHAAVFVASRPPGHHALADGAMGFCYFNTAAVVAADLVAAGATRVLVADFDVHHGNGTQEIFWEDGRVAYLSVHRWPFYPGTGAADEEGAGRGRGATVNVPRPAGAGDAAYAGSFVAALERLAERFRPEFVVVSAGFDSHRRDPLGGMSVTEEGFARMSGALRQVADTFAGGRVVSLLEGGYHPAALADSALVHVGALA